MGHFPIGQSAKATIQANFHRFETLKPMGPSKSRFCLVVDGLHRSGGNGFFDPEPIQQKRSMLAERRSHFFRGLFFGSHGVRTPIAGKPPGPKPRFSDTTLAILPENWRNNTAFHGVMAVMRPMGRVDFICQWQRRRNRGWWKLENSATIPPCAEAGTGPGMKRA